jgi:hypothetical protein
VYLLVIVLEESGVLPLGGMPVVDNSGAVGGRKAADAECCHEEIA